MHPRSIAALFRRSRRTREGYLESILIRFAVYFVPAALLVATAYAFFGLDHQYRADGAQRLEFQILEDETGELTPSQSLARLKGQAVQTTAETRLSMKPFWLRFTVRTRPGEQVDVEFSSRHSLEVTCWRDAAFQTPVASANRQTATGKLRLVKAGFAMTVSSMTEETQQFLCRTTYEGPAKIELIEWPADALQINTNNFHRASGLLEGGLLALALFVFMFAILNREWTYVVFAGWLVANLRVAALSAGWDLTWVERIIPSDWTYEFRKAAMSGYIAMTVALFIRLFSDELRQLKHYRVQWILIAAALLALIEAAILPFRSYVPIMWLTAAVAASTLAFLLIRVIVKTPSRVAIWYSLSMILNVGTGVYEIIAASFGIRQYIGAVNSVTGAIASSLLAAIAIAEQIRQDRLARLEAQAIAVSTLQRFKDTYKALPIGLFTVNTDQVITQFNPAFEKIFSISATRKHVFRWTDFFSEVDWLKVQAANAANGSVELELPHRDASADRWFIIKANSKDEILECSLQDITEKRRASQRLAFLASHDPLTGLLNRRGIEHHLAASLEQAHPGSRGALAYVDLNRFKLINDLYGHVTGDDVLQQVAARLTATCGGESRIGRIGGDEFVIVFPESDLTNAIATCEQFLDAIQSSAFAIADKAFQVGAAVGLIELRSDLSIRDALATADRACQEAKQSGRPIIFYRQNTATFENKISELRMLEQIGRQVPFDRMFLEMQPIMSLRQPHQNLDFEILIRMREENGTIVPPGKFLGAAEKNGQMTEIDQWVLLNALQWIDKHLHALSRTNFICLNLSGASINDERFIENAFGMLGEHKNAARLLCFEITEDIALRDLKNTSRIIDRLKAHGSRVALDDFGAGYTSFSYLKELPADFLKVDGQFIREINQNPANYAIIRAIVELANHLGMQSIAEWAEDVKAIESLMKVKADYAQGWVISKSQSPDAILRASSSGAFVADPDLTRLLQRSSRQVANAATSASRKRVVIPS
jgi:diguanylate cyclase (GGDEF)-like protein